MTVSFTIKVKIMNEEKKPLKESSDEFARFLSAQSRIYDQVLKELSEGRKQAHWIWFIFPQLRGLGQSTLSRRYAIVSLKQARKYLDHEILGSRLRHCAKLMLELDGKSVDSVLGSLNAMKFHYCMTLFALCSDEGNVFAKAIDKYFSGIPDQRTLQLLELRSELPSKEIN